jgi:PAS domain S-box-containing protein
MTQESHKLFDYPSELLLTHLFDRLPVGTAVFDRQFRLLRCNATWAEFIARYTPATANEVRPGVSLFDLAPGTEKAIEPLFTPVFAGETVRQEALRLETGSIVSYWDVLLAPLEMDGEVVAALDVSLDVTERVLTEQRLQETLESLHRSQERLALAQQGTTDGIWDWNVLTGEVYFSPRWKNMLGYGVDELEDNFDSWRQLIHPDDRASTLATLEAHLAGEQEIYRVEHRLRHKDGAYRWILSRGAAIRDEQGRAVRMAGSHTDITQRREAAEALQQRVAFEKLITTISNKFINMPPGEIPQGIYEALQAIGRFTAADRVYIFLYAEDGRTMSCVQEWCAAGIAPQIDRLQARSVTDLAWTNRQLLLQQVLHIPRVADLPPEAAAEKAEFQEQDIQSLLAVPMTYQEKVVGFLGFDAVRQEMAWTAVFISLLQIVGEIFVNALEHKRSREALQAANRRLEERVARRTQELERRNQELDRQRRGAESLRSVLALLNSNQPLPELLAMITRQASELMGGETAVAIFQYDPRRERFELRASHQLSPFLSQLESVPVSAIGGESFKQRQIFVIRDVAQHVTDLLPRLSPSEPELITAFETLRAHYRSYLAAPLIVRGALYGGIAFHYTDMRALDEEDVNLALTLSEQAALAIENARLVEAERRRRAESERRRQVAEGLRDILARLNSSQTLPELLDAIVGQADLLIDSDVVALYLLQDDGQNLRIQALRGEIPAEMRQVNLPIGAGTIGRVVAQRQPMIVPDVSQLHIYNRREEALAAVKAVFVDEERQEALAAAIRRFQAVLALPLVAQDVAFGGLAFYYSQPRDFSEEEVNLAMTFADQAALAIQNARLRDHAEEAAVLAERNRLARELHDAVTQTLFSASLIADVLPRIWERSPETGEAKLAELRELTRGALAEMRTLLLELRPATLTESSLDELLQQLAAAVTGRSRVQVKVELEGEEKRPLPPDIQVTFYRIAQEALNNVVKHSGATAVAVTLCFLPDQVSLTVADNGRGFDPAAASVHSLGLGIMRERAAKIGADLKVDSTIGLGTKVHVQV